MCRRYIGGGRKKRENGRWKKQGGGKGWEKEGDGVKEQASELCY